MSTTDPLTLVISSVDQLREDVTRRLGDQDKVMAAIKEQTTKTNGRVTALERKQIAEEAARKAVERERGRVDQEQKDRVEKAHRFQDTLDTITMMGMLAATVLVPLLIAGRI